jgi:Predicted membrane protein
MVVIGIIAGYFALMNLIGFAMMGIDKHKAVKKLWRIPEYTFFVVALIGGSIGTIVGMRVFRHKTRHWYFVYGLPAILVLQVALVLFVANSPLQFSIM